MELKTRISAENGKQDLVVTREFDLPVDLLFKAYVEPEIVEEWMGTKVLKLECKKHGSYQFETTDPRGNKHGFHGVIHEFVPEQKITRTFQMERSQLPVQLEFLEFQRLSDDRSKLIMHIVYRSVADRDEMLRMPFAQGINMAHNRLEEIVRNLNKL